MEDLPLLRRYWCFLAYRHSDNRERGRQWATWLHQQIETFEVPPSLVGTKNSFNEVIPERIYPVFRDEEALSPSLDLGASIERALEQSKFLVVLCSPAAAQSQFIQEEIRHFKNTGRSNRIVPVLIEGSPDLAFPRALVSNTSLDGEYNDEAVLNPVAADFRLEDGSQGWTTPSYLRQHLTHSGLNKQEIEFAVQRYTAKLELSKLRIISTILGVPVDQLVQRDKRYALQLTKTRRSLLLLGTVLLAGNLIQGWIILRSAPSSGSNGVVSAFILAMVVGLLFGLLAPKVLTPRSRFQFALFISYRRLDSHHPAHLVHRELARVFGHSHVFIDVDSIQGGEDFRKVVETAISDSQVVIVIMGNQWLKGIDRESDFVRQEVLTAMRTSKVVIPLIVDGQGMPAPTDLPKDIERLSYMNARQLRSGPAFWEDIKTLKEDLKRERQKAITVH